MSDVLIPVSTAAAGRFITKSEALQMSLPAFMEQISNSLDLLLQTHQQAVAPSLDHLEVAAVKKVRKVPIKKSPILVEAVERAKSVPTGEKFSLANLFIDDWHLLPSPRVFGRMFKRAVESQGIAKHKGNDPTVGMARYVRL